SFMGTNSSSVYFCPVDRKSKYFSQRVNKLCSYIMNGAVCGYGKLPAGNPPATAAIVSSVKITAIRSQMSFIMWEPDETLNGIGAFAFNDASSFPDRNEGIGHLHMSGATSLAIDGHVPFLKFRTFETERNNMPGLLWWYPGSANGQ